MESKIHHKKTQEEKRHKKKKVYEQQKSKADSEKFAVNSAQGFNKDLRGMVFEIPFSGC